MPDTVTADIMASKRLYEPAARHSHATSSFSIEGLAYVWGGRTHSTESGSEKDLVDLASNIEQFDPYLELWTQLNTAGTPHPGLWYTACASTGEHLYMYGGYNIRKDEFDNTLSYLSVKTLTWSQLYPAGTVGGLEIRPMGKMGCGIVHFHHDKLAVVGGYGIPTGPIQPETSFTMFTEGRGGYSNEIHVFDISQGTISIRVSLNHIILAIYIYIYIITIH